MAFKESRKKLLAKNFTDADEKKDQRRIEKLKQKDIAQGKHQTLFLTLEQNKKKNGLKSSEIPMNGAFGGTSLC